MNHGFEPPPEAVNDLAGAVLAHFTVGRDAIVLSFEKRFGETLKIFDVITYGRIEVPGSSFDDDEGSTAAALPTLAGQIGRHLLRIDHSGVRRYRFEFVNGVSFEMADPNEYSDYAVKIDVRIASSNTLESFMLLDD